MNVVVCPKCFAEMGFEKLPIYVVCKKCSHRFLPSETAQPQLGDGSKVEKPHFLKSPTEKLLRLLRCVSLVIVGFFLMLPAIIYDAVDTKLVSDSPVPWIAFGGGLIFATGIISFFMILLIDLLDK